MGRKDRSGSYIKFFAYLVAIVLMNVAGTTLFFRIDLTANRIYSISEISQRVVSTLSEPLTINVFFTKNLPAPHNNTERYLHDLLEEYSVYANQHFNYRFYDVSPDEGDLSQKAGENQELARSYGIHPVQIQRIEKDELKFQKAYMGLVLIHGDIIEKIPTITSTARLEYRLTTAIQKLNNKISALLNLQEKVRVKLFLSSSLKMVAPFMRLDKLSELSEVMERAIETLNSKLYGKLEFQYLDPTQDKSLEKELDRYGIMTLKWPELSGKKRIRSGKGSIGLVLEYGDSTAVIPLIQSIRLPLIGTHYELIKMEELEEVINENLESLIGINEDIGYLADHNTLNLSGAGARRLPGQVAQDIASNFQSLLSHTYSIRNVNLSDGTVPDSLNCLIIARPREKFSEYELFQIDQFLMRGKSLALFLDAFHEVSPPGGQGMPLSFGQGPVYSPLNTGIEKLLEHYGISLKRSYVMDENSYKQELSASFGGGEQPIYFAPLIKDRFINKNLGFMKNIKALVVAKISPLDVNTERINKNGLHAHKLFASSEKSWEMSGRINLNPMMIRPPKSGDEQKSLPLAYVIEGEFPSYFAGKEIPEKESKEDTAENKEQERPEDQKLGDLSKIESKGEILEQGKPGKIFVIGSSTILGNNMLDSESTTTNSTFIINVIDYLNSREDIAIMRSKEHRFNPLIDTGAGTRTFIKSFNIAGLPVLVALFGLLVLILRQSRKRRIQMMFQK